MISFEVFKKSLGKLGEQLSDRSIEELMKLEYQCANTLFDLWRDKQETQMGSTSVVVHKKDGNAIGCVSFGFAYAYVH